MTPELAQADLVAVPVRFGSGTRVKIAEAFAHQIPVVSTTLGCEGLDVVPGTHLLVADEPDAFASRCVEALTDRSLRRAITQAAHEIYLSRYRSEIVSSEITKLASAVAGEAASSRRERMRSRKAVRHSAARDG
jgi:glycosyltransferase involved in cell wall biosynthesis